MKNFMCKCGVCVVILALAAGIFCVFWSMKSQNMEKGGTLVKNMCEEMKECLNL